MVFKMQISRGGNRPRNRQGTGFDLILRGRPPGSGKGGSTRRLTAALPLAFVV